MGHGRHGPTVIMISPMYLAKATWHYIGNIFALLFNKLLIYGIRCCQEIIKFIPTTGHSHAPKKQKYMKTEIMSENLKNLLKRNNIHRER